jgi:hypothetical protein
MLSGETIPANYQYHTLHCNPLSEKYAKFLTFKAGGTNTVTAEL